MRLDVKLAAHRQATKKLADKYVGRRGEPPSLSLRPPSAPPQELNDDDRHRLQWCLDQLKVAAWGQLEAPYQFIEAILNRDYGLDRIRPRPEDFAKPIDRRQDPALYDHLVRKSRDGI